VTSAYVGIGSNVGEPRAQVLAALAKLGGMPRTRLVGQSSLYASAPLGYADQPQFVNAVAALDTELPAMRLLHELQALETAQGRRRSFKNAPRTLDLDILLYGDVVLQHPALTLPHPRMHERAFVLRPLVELAPQVVIPGIGAAAACLANCADQHIERIG
jgi:2-amino-4-hydroxy-6-hydroxymethyldihydropteridine diphosphokinase